MSGVKIATIPIVTSTFLRTCLSEVRELSRSMLAELMRWYCPGKSKVIHLLCQQWLRCMSTCFPHMPGKGD